MKDLFWNISLFLIDKLRYLCVCFIRHRHHYNLVRSVDNGRVYICEDCGHIVAFLDIPKEKS